MDTKGMTDRQKFIDLMGVFGVTTETSDGYDVVISAKIGNVWLDFDETGKFESVATGE